jgi:hypothetical protein
MGTQTIAPIVGKLPNWDTKASVRVKPRRLVFQEEEAMGKVYFSPELVPIGQHPLVRQFGSEATRELQVRHLYRYLDFTTQLELEVINSVAKDIALEKLGLDLPDVMREDAFKLCTDEAHYAYFSDDIKRQVVAATGLEPARLGAPVFLRHLRAIQKTLPSEITRLSELLFTVVSETIISSILFQLPKDERVVSAVRQSVADHAEDEGRHSAYFSQFFSYLWPQLPEAHRTVLGPLLPHFILAFLQPDHDAIWRSLSHLPLEHDQIETVIAETYPRSQVVADAKGAASVTLRLLAHRGVMDDPRIADEFRSTGLAD